MSDSDNLQPKFALSEGAGTPLGEHPCLAETPTRRGAAAQALENALEPLHRWVYGRPGRCFERRGALEMFKGFPTALSAELRDKVSTLTTARLREMIKTLRIPTKVSQPQPQLIEAVHAFLMCPSPPAAKAKTATKAPPTKRPRTSPEATGEKPADLPPAKKAKQEAAPAAGGTGVTEDAVRVQVYRRVLAMTPAQRASLGTKALRLELEAHFGLPEKGLRHFKDAIAETASDCIRALVEAEQLARGAAPPQNPHAAEHTSDTAASAPPSYVDAPMPAAPAPVAAPPSAPATAAVAAPLPVADPLPEQPLPQQQQSMPTPL